MGILPGIAKANGRITNEFLYDAEKDTALAEPDSNRKIRAIIQPTNGAIMVKEI